MFGTLAGLLEDEKGLKMGSVGFICLSIAFCTNSCPMKNTSLLGLPVGFGYGYESLITLISQNTVKTLAQNPVQFAPLAVLFAQAV